MGFKIKVPKINVGNIGSSLISPVAALGSANIKLDDKSLDNFGKNLTGYISPLAAMMNNKGPNDPPPGEDPQLTALRNRTQQEASQFRQDLPGLMNEQSQIIGADANAAREAGTRSARRNFNDRGLLYSGMRQKEEGDVRSRVASQMSRSLADSRREFENMARAKENVAAQVGLQGYQDALRRADEAYNLNMQNTVARRQTMQQLGQAGGYMAGAGFGSSGRSAPQTSTSSSDYARPSGYDNISTPTGTYAKASRTNQPGLLDQGYKIYG